MDQKKLIEEINALSKKAKIFGLTASEKHRQKILREEYMDRFRKNFKNQLDGIEIVDK